MENDAVRSVPDGLSSAAPIEPLRVSPVPASIPSARTNGRGTVFWVPVENAIMPSNGDCIVDHWWSVHPDKGLAFYAHLHGYAASESPSPQCNQSESTARMLCGKLWPDHEVRKIPVVFMAHADRAMAKLKAQAIEARRAETQSGSVHESAVGETDAPNTQAETPSDTGEKA